MKNILIALVIALLIDSSAHAASMDRCEDQIKELVCLVDAPRVEKERYRDGRTCLPESQKYQKLLLSAFKAYPPFVQRVLCGLRKIYIEKSFFGPAWSGLVDEGNPTSGIIGLRQKDLDANLPFEHYQSWFEQQSFVLNTNFEIDLRLPVVRQVSSYPADIKGYTYTLLHEVGHIIDYQKKFNEEGCVKGCSPRSNSWMAISWTSIQTPDSSSDFPRRGSICLNNCNGKFINASDAPQLYKEIYEHGFVSQLASINAMEDFAESFAVYVASKYMDLHFEIFLENGEIYRLDDVLRTKKFQSKLEFLNSQIIK